MTALRRLDPESGEIESYAHDPDDSGSLGRGYITAIVEDRDGRLWVGTGEDGLSRLHEDGSGFDRFVHDPTDPDSLSDDYVTTLHQDRHGTLWVGTRSGGLNGLEPGSSRFVRYLPDPADETTLGHHYVTSITEDANGILWIGTAGGGLTRVDGNDVRGRVQFTRFGENEGLIDDNVMGIAADGDGSLWVSTKAGLARFDPTRTAFAQYGVRDGLPSANFNVGAASRGSEHVVFGSTNGVVAVPLDSAFPRRDRSPTVLRSVRTLEDVALGNGPAWSLENLEVPWGRVLTFEFAVLDYADPARHRYAYRLEGIREEWVNLGTRREITFTDLDPGDYTLEIRGRNSLGVWSYAPVALRLQVVPPFWMTWWFRGGALFSLVWVVLGVHRLRMATQRKRIAELQSLKTEREQALERARTSQDALHAAYERLRGLTRRLENAKEDERKRIARELHDEMGQALTTAKINLQLIADDEVPADRERRIVDTVGLIDRMIGHVRTLSLDLRPPLLDELGLVPALKGYLEIQSHRAGIEIDVEASTIPPGLQPELEIAGFRVVQEAITNVVRHARAEHVDVKVRHADGWIELTVKDDGRGFDVDATLERAFGGHHLGLLGIRERVESMGGAVEIRSSPGAGTEIRVKVPLHG
jgi:signal transduction histidine kinase/streptogramin lyase